MPAIRGHRYEDLGYNVNRMSYRVYEKNPELVLANRHLQVTCSYDNCHPTWTRERYTSLQTNNGTRSHFRWQNDTFAIHWEMTDLAELDDFETMRKSSELIAEIGRFIIRKAQIGRHKRN